MIYRRAFISIRAGCRSVGNMLAVALETPREKGKNEDLLRCNVEDPTEEDIAACNRYHNYEQAPHRTAVHFYDVSDPEAPVFKSQFIPFNSNGETVSVAGTIAITPLPNGKLSDGANRRERKPHVVLLPVKSG